LIPANLIHANGGGMLVLEVGTFGGITYRLYDYGRPRKLNVEEALAIMNPSLRTTVTHHPLPSKAMNQWDQGINCDRFTVDILDVAEMAPLEQRPYYYILSCVNNECDVLTEDGVFHLDYTQTLMIPASYGFLQIRGKCRVLVSHVRY
jgi:mannose-6-phosphate isomerase